MGPAFMIANLVNIIPMSLWQLLYNCACRIHGPFWGENTTTHISHGGHIFCSYPQAQASRFKVQLGDIAASYNDSAGISEQGSLRFSTGYTRDRRYVEKSIVPVKICMFGVIGCYLWPISDTMYKHV